MTVCAESGRLYAETTVLYAGRGDGGRLIAAFRDALLLTPTDADGALMAGETRGLRWVLAFTDQTVLARWAKARYAATREISFRSVFGWRLLDVMIPEVTTPELPAGVAVNVGSPRPLLLPPAAGIVPASAAIDAAVKPTARDARDAVPAITVDTDAAGLVPHPRSIVKTPGVGRPDSNWTS